MPLRCGKSFAGVVCKLAVKCNRADLLMHNKLKSILEKLFQTPSRNERYKRKMKTSSNKKHVNNHYNRYTGFPQPLVD